VCVCVIQKPQNGSRGGGVLLAEVSQKNLTNVKSHLHLLDPLQQRCSIFLSGVADFIGNLINSADALTKLSPPLANPLSTNYGNT